MGQVQNGELDLYTTERFLMEVYDSNDSMIPSPIINDDTTKIGSFYNVTTTSHEGNLLSMFTAIPLGLWIGYLAAFFIFVSITYLGSYILKHSYSCLWNTVRAFLDQDNFPINSRFISTFSVVVMVSMFFLLSYLTNSMGTELVTIDKPTSITSYKQIIEKKIGIVISEQYALYDMLRSAEVGSIEHELFKQINRNMLHVTCSDYYDQSNVRLSTPCLVYITSLICASSFDFPLPHGRMLHSTDENTKESLNVVVMSSRWRGTDVKSAIMGS